MAATLLLSSSPRPPPPRPLYSLVLLSQRSPTAAPAQLQLVWTRVTKLKKKSKAWTFSEGPGCPKSPAPPLLFSNRFGFPFISCFSTAFHSLALRRTSICLRPRCRWYCAHHTCQAYYMTAVTFRTSFCAAHSASVNHFTLFCSFLQRPSGVFWTSSGFLSRFLSARVTVMPGLPKISATLEIFFSLPPSLFRAVS